MKKGILLTGLLFSANVLAANLTGNITIMKKGSVEPEQTYANASVYITGIRTSAPVKSRVQVQKDKQFFPRLMTVVKGQSVDFLNQDRVKHNVFSTNEKTPFDLARYPAGEFRSVTFNETGVQTVYCNIHSQMVSYINVVENRYFAQTDELGNYSIKDIPEGRYKLHVWHVYGGMASREITLTSVDQSVNFTLKSTKVIRDLGKHKNKFGKNYKKLRQRSY